MDAGKLAKLLEDIIKEYEYRRDLEIDDQPQATYFIQKETRETVQGWRNRLADILDEDYLSSKSNN
jgi:hypothetical protein